MRRQSLIGVVAACVLALAACGGGSDGDGNTGVILQGEQTGEVDTNSTLYSAAYGVCSSASPEEIKSNYRTRSTEPDVIAQDVAQNLAGGNPLDEPNARAGCLAGLKAYSGG